MSDEPEPAEEAPAKPLLASRPRSSGIEEATPFYVEERLAKLTAQEGIPFLSLPQPMADYAAKNCVFLHGFPNAVPLGGHWNHLGHRLADEWLADDYCKRLTAATPAGAAP